MMTRGQKPRVDDFINDLLAQPFLIGEPNEAGNRMQLFLSVRPIQFWEFAFPKEHFKTVLATIAPGFNNTKGRQREMLLLQKARFLVQGKKIPKMDLTNELRRLVRVEGVGNYPFAIKEDQVFKEGDTLDNGQPCPKELIGYERI